MVRIAFCLLFCGWVARGGEEPPLTRRLPAKTALFLKLEAGRFLTEMDAYLHLVSPEHGEKIHQQGRQLLEQLKEFSAHHEFKPALLDQLTALKAYFVMIPLDQAVVRTKTLKLPKEDEETGEELPGQFEETTIEETQDSTLALLLETTPESAQDFLTQLKALQVRLKERHPEDERFGYRQKEVEQGELISDPEEETSFGRLGPYLVLSQNEPRELWQNLQHIAPEPLEGGSLLERLKPGLGAAPPALLGLVNLAGILSAAEKELRGELEEAKAEAAKTGLEAEEAQEAAQNVRMATKKLSSYLVAKKIFSLESLRGAGVNLDLKVTGKTAQARMIAALELTAARSGILDALLNGGHPLELPPLGKPEGLLLLTRVGLKEIYEGVVASLEAPIRMALELQMGQLKSMIGFTLPEILAQLSGDLYLSLDVEKKPHQVEHWNEQTEQMETVTVTGPIPEILLLFGTQDGDASSKMLSQIFTTFSVTPIGPQYVKKRIYQESPVYLVGRDVSKEGVDPDGRSAFAVTQVGRFLALGSWNDVTGLIRTAKSGEAKIAQQRCEEILASRRNAQTLVIVPRAFVEKASRLKREKEERGADSDLETLLEGLEELPLPPGSEELKGRLKSSLKILLPSLEAIEREGEKLVPDLQFGYGQLNGNFYEFSFSQELVAP